MDQMTSEICSGLWFIAELCFILIAFCTTAVGASCPGGVGSGKCVISTATAGALRREERHGKRRWVGWEKHDPSLLYTVCWGEGKKIVSWGKGDKRDFCALVGRGCPSVLEFPWCYLCSRLMVKLTALLMHFAVQGLGISLTGSHSEQWIAWYGCCIPGRGEKLQESMVPLCYAMTRLIHLLCILLI